MLQNAFMWAVALAVLCGLILWMWPKSNEQLEADIKRLKLKNEVRELKSKRASHIFGGWKLGFNGLTLAVGLIVMFLLSLVMPLPIKTGILELMATAFMVWLGWKLIGPKFGFGKKPSGGGGGGGNHHS
ncbi:MAG TPA: hypothetical protein VG984_03250 [Candidatus Paceibacterota bacterium]|nr:hypothetical protein [Candidatus Paceibacterota bacterium]